VRPRVDTAAIFRLREMPRCPRVLTELRRHRACCAKGIFKETFMAKEPKKLDELFYDTLKDIFYAEKKIAGLKRF
jgi:hypothetical protein